MKASAMISGVFDVRVNFTEIVSERPAVHGASKERQFFIPRRAYKPMYILDMKISSGPAWVESKIVNRRVRRDSHLVTKCTSLNVSENETFEDLGCDGTVVVPFLLIKSRSASPSQIVRCEEMNGGEIPKMVFGYRSNLTKTSPLHGITEDELASMCVLAELKANTAARELNQGFILVGRQIGRRFLVHADRMGRIDVIRNNGSEQVIKTYEGPM